MRRLYIVLVALAVLLPLGVAAQGVKMTIDAIEKGGHIDGTVTGLTEANRRAYKVVVYAKKDKWYIHPYLRGGDGKAWSSIMQNGTWRVETLHRDGASSALAALLVKRESVVPAQVADVREIPHEAIIVRELEGTPDYDKL
jgi:hypothetical protein